jgi:hypothetical protein
MFTPRPLAPLFDLAGQLGGELADLCRARAAREDLFTALLGSQVETAVLEAASACGPADLDELVASGLVVAGGGRLKFRHEIAVLAKLDVPTRNAAASQAATLGLVSAVESR